MGVDLFGVDIAAIVADALGPGLQAATLTKVTNGVRTPGNLAGGTNPTTTIFACRGVEVDLEQRFVGVVGGSGDTVRRTDAAVMLIGDTIDGGATVPEAGDRVALAGGAARAVVAVLESDPARATYTLAVRG
jgi:orotate phosphoribosyltransferase-like protein